MYKVVTADNAESFNREINQLLDSGWTLHGDTKVSVMSRREMVGEENWKGEKNVIVYTQALTKEDNISRAASRFLRENEARKKADVSVIGVSLYDAIGKKRG